MISDNLLIIELVSRRIVIVLLNTSLKGLLIISCLYLFLSMVRKINIRSRHLLWFLSLAGLIILPVVSLLFQQLQINAFMLSEDRGRVYRTVSAIAAMQLGPVNIGQTEQTLSGMTGSAVKGLRWTLFIAVWFLGFLTVFLRTLLGSIRVRRIIRTGSAVRDKVLLVEIHDICRVKGLRSTVDLYSNRQTSSPFTVGVFKPTIVLPANMLTWSLEEIKPILLHEINHIARKDYLTQKSATFICGLFWFLPVTWIALKKLYIEQENICDEEVLLSGIEPAHYASQMLRIAKSMVRTASTPGLALVNGRAKLFEKRIINVLQERRSKMKKKKLVFIGIAYLLALSIIAGCTTTRKAISKEDFYSAWVGTWVNEELPGTPLAPQKVITNPDGTYDLYFAGSDSLSQLTLKIKLIEQWVDQEGNIWYRASMLPVSDHGSDWYDFGKISKDGKSFEHMYHGSADPIEKWDPENEFYNYAVYYRD